MSPKPLLTWKSCPFVERPLTTVVLVLFLIFLSLILWNITVVNWNSPLFYYGGLLLVIISLLPYFIVTDYELFDDLIVIHYLFVKVQRKYEDFGCYYKDKYGIMLGTFKMPRRLDSFRGQSLRFSKTKEEQSDLIAILQSKIGKQY